MIAEREIDIAVASIDLAGAEIEPLIGEVERPWAARGQVEGLLWMRPIAARDVAHGVR